MRSQNSHRRIRSKHSNAMQRLRFHASMHVQVLRHGQQQPQARAAAQHALRFPLSVLPASLSAAQHGAYPQLISRQPPGYGGWSKSAECAGVPCEPERYGQIGYATGACSAGALPRHALLRSEEHRWAVLWGNACMYVCYIHTNIQTYIHTNIQTYTHYHEARSTDELSFEVMRVCMCVTYTCT